MGLYGQNAYNATVYGNAAAGLSSVTFTANPSPAAYAGLLLNWSTPGGSWDRLRIVRNRFGFPVTPDDGTVLVDSYTPETYGSGQYGSGAYGGSVVTPTQYLDNSNLIPSTFYYYAMFVRQPQGAALPWTRVAVTIGQSVGDHKYKDWLLERIPSIFTTTGGSVEEGPEPGTAIARFLNVFGSDVNRARDFLDHLNHVEDPDTVHGDLLVTLCQNWGYAFEPSIGMKQNRVLAKNAVYLRQKKGTTAGVQALASAVTGWGAKQLSLTNLMLDENDASFEQSTGNWMVTSGQATLAQNKTVSFSDGNETSAASLQVTCNSASGNITLGTVGTSSYGMGGYGVGPFSTQAANLYGIPVTAGEQYILSGYFRSAVTTRNPILDIQWYDQTGTLISTTSGTSGAATTTTDWTCRVSTQANAPGGAVWAAPVIRWSSGTLALNEVQYVDALQFEHHRNLLSYANSSFESTVGSWTGVNATLSSQTTYPYDGGHSLDISPSGASNDSYATLTIDCAPNTTYTVSGYISLANTLSGTLNALSRTITVYEYDSADVALEATHTSNVGDNYTTGTRLSTTFTTTGSTAKLHLRLYNGGSTGAGDVFFDAIQVEQGSARTAFDTASLQSYSPARQVRVDMIAPRVNEARNAGFDVDVTQWSAFTASTAWNNTVTYNGGIGSCKVTPSGDYPQIYQASVGCDVGSPVTVAAQIFPTVAAHFQISVEFFDYRHGAISVNYGTSTLLAANAWGQITYTGTVPANAVTMTVFIVLNETGTVARNTFYVDDVQIEMSPSLLPYFDLRLNSGDVKWEGASYNSRLHYYANFGPRDTRLSDLLSKHIPLGASYTLLFAQPRGTL